jgi:hypothetical protein
MVHEILDQVLQKRKFKFEKLNTKMLLFPIAQVNLICGSILTKRYFPRMACAQARQTGTSSD